MPKRIDLPRFFCNYCNEDFQTYKDCLEHEQNCELNPLLHAHPASIGKSEITKSKAEELGIYVHELLLQNKTKPTIGECIAAINKSTESFYNADKIGHLIKAGQC